MADQSENLSAKPGKYGVSLDGPIGTFSRIDPRRDWEFRELASHLSNFRDQVSNPLKHLRESIEGQLKGHLMDRFGEEVRVRIVNPENVNLLELPSRKGNGEKVFSPAVLERGSDGKKTIYLCESIFTFEPNKDRKRNVRLQNATAVRLCGMLFAQEYLDDHPRHIGSKIALMFSRHEDSGFAERSLALATAIMYGCSRKGMKERLHPPEISRITSWDVIKSRFDLSQDENLLFGTEYNYQYLCMLAGSNKIKRSDNSTTHPQYGDLLEAVGIALPKLASFRGLQDVDIVGQAALLYYLENSAYNNEDNLLNQLDQRSITLSNAMRALSVYPFDIPPECDTTKADFQLASLHQRFIQTILKVSQEHKVSAHHLCALALTNAYVEAVTIDRLPEKEQQQAQKNSFYLYAACSDRLANLELADDIRYAAFAGSSPQDLHKARTMLGGYTGLDMRGARKLEIRLRKLLEKNQTSSEYPELIKTEVRLKGYFSLHEKLHEIGHEIQEGLCHHGKAVCDGIMTLLGSVVSTKYRHGSLEERNKIFSEMILKIDALITDTTGLVDDQINTYLGISGKKGVLPITNGAARALEEDIKLMLARYGDETVDEVLSCLRNGADLLVTQFHREPRLFAENVRRKVNKILKHQDVFLVGDQIKKFLDVTDPLGIRLVVKHCEDVESISGHLQKIFKQAIPDAGVSFHENWKVKGLRKIEDNETLNPDPSVRTKISNQAVVWKLHRFGLLVEKSPGESWEIPIEVQVISEEEYVNQKIGREPRKYGYSHWWLKVMRGVLNDLKERGKSLDNSYCGPQMHFQEGEHDGTSFVDAFDAASYSLDRAYVAVRDNKGIVHELSGNFELSITALVNSQFPGGPFEVTKLSPFGRSVAEHRQDVMISAGMYQLHPLKGKVQPLTEIVTPHQLLSAFKSLSQEEGEHILARGGNYFNSRCCRGSLVDDNPSYSKLFDWANDFVPAYFQMSDLEELCRYVGLLLAVKDETVALPEAVIKLDVEEELNRIQRTVSKLIQTHFYFSEVKLLMEPGMKLFQISSREHHPSLLAGLLALVPTRGENVPYQLAGGSTSVQLDGEMIELLFNNMPEDAAMSFFATAQRFAIPKGSESVYLGTPEKDELFWLVDLPGVFKHVLDAAHANGLDIPDFNLRASPIRIQYDGTEIPPEQQEFGLESYVQTRLRFKWMATPDGTQADLDRAVEDVRKTLAQKRYIPAN